MAKMKLTETLVSVGQILERDAAKLPQGVLCRARYNICNLGELNRNKRIYERRVWENVLANKDIQEKIQKKSLYAHAEHPEGMQSSTEKIAGIVSKIEIGEKNVYAVMEVLDTPYGRICDTLLRAGCGLGTSTRAEGELEEAVDEATGNRFYRVVPESYNFVTVDWTADPSTYGAFPESVERDIAGLVKSGMEAKKIDAQYAAVLLEKMKCKEAVSLRESIQKDLNEAEMQKSVWIYRLIDPKGVIQKEGAVVADTEEEANKLVAAAAGGLKPFVDLDTKDFPNQWGLPNTPGLYSLDESTKKKIKEEWGVHTSDGEKVNKMEPIPKLPGEGLVNSSDDPQKTKESTTPRIKVVERPEIHKDWVCPHCNEVIHEKGLGYREETKQYFHRGPCHEKALLLPEQTAEEKKAYAAFAQRFGLTESKCLKEATKDFANLEIEVDGKIYEVDGFVRFTVDEQYGSDADGNRGSPRTFIQDVIIDHVVDESGASVQVNDAIQKAVDARVNEMDLSEGKITENAQGKINYYRSIEKVTKDALAKGDLTMDEAEDALAAVVNRVLVDDSFKGVDESKKKTNESQIDGIATIINNVLMSKKTEGKLTIQEIDSLKDQMMVAISKVAGLNETKINEVTGVMADFTVRAIRTSDKSLRTELVIHNNEVVAKTPDMTLGDTTYEKCFSAAKKIIEGLFESTLNEQGGSHTTGLAELFKAFDESGLGFLAPTAKKKIDESKTIKEKATVISNTIKEYREIIAMLQAENAKLVEIAEADLSSVRSNYAKDVIDFNKKLAIVKEELKHTSENAAKMIAEAKEKFEADKAGLNEAIRKEFETKIAGIENMALESTKKIYEGMFNDLKTKLEKETEEMREHYNHRLMKLIADIKIKEAGLESEITPKHLALLEACKSEEQIVAKLAEIRLHIKEASFHSNEFKNGGSQLTINVNETVSQESQDLKESLGQTAHLLRTVK